MKPKIEISENHLQEVATILNRLLANEFVLYTKTRGAHWNVQGANFISLHKFFKDQYEELESSIDDIAERIRSLGHFSLYSLKDFLRLTDMLENNSDFGTQESIIKILLSDHETVICTSRNEITNVAEEYKDLGTADFITGIVERHEKMAWMLRAHLT